MCMCVCVCVCEREREREREGKKRAGGDMTEVDINILIVREIVKMSIPCVHNLHRVIVLSF